MLWQERSLQDLKTVCELVADTIVETLQSAGVEHCYGVLGDTIRRGVAGTSGNR
jgi:hypothetical protein